MDNIGFICVADAIRPNQQLFERLVKDSVSEAINSMSSDDLMKAFFSSTHTETVAQFRKAA